MFSNGFLSACQSKMTALPPSTMKIKVFCLTSGEKYPSMGLEDFFLFFFSASSRCGTSKGEYDEIPAPHRPHSCVLRILRANSLSFIHDETVYYLLLFFFLAD